MEGMFLDILDWILNEYMKEKVNLKMFKQKKKKTKTQEKEKNNKKRKAKIEETRFI